jgi:hypothetical protein
LPFVSAQGSTRQAACGYEARMFRIQRLFTFAFWAAAIFAYVAASARNDQRG